MSKTIEMLLNLGWQDALQISVDETKFTEGTTHTLDDEKAKFLVSHLHCARYVEPAMAAASGKAEEKAAEIGEEFAADAIADIAAMKAKDKAALQNIVNTDTRKTVVEAAKKRLAELG